MKQGPQKKKNVISNFSLLDPTPIVFPTPQRNRLGKGLLHSTKRRRHRNSKRSKGRRPRLFRRKFYEKKLTLC